MTDEQIQLANRTKKIYCGYTHDEMSRAFDAVKNPEHWKNPIKSRVSAESLSLTIAAIRFFTGTDVSIKQTGSYEFEVSSIGYRNGPAGDH